MSDMRRERNEKRSPKKNIGFYISLAVCLAAVAGAAWTTYGSIRDYRQITEESIVEESHNTTVNDEVSGQPYDQTSLQESSSPESKEESNEKQVSGKEDLNAAEESVRPSNTEPVSSIPEESGPMTAEPVDKGEILKPFSPKNPLRSVTMNDWRTHSGVDIKAGEGSPVRAVMEGTVSKFSNDPMMGYVIEIEHTGGYMARYCGMTDTPVVQEGSHVKAGDTIGYIGKIPSESKDESHLHLEMLLDGNPVDPTLIY